MGYTLVVIDALWGDAGKGKIGAYIAYHQDYDIAVRAGTGTNAGHSLYKDHSLFKTNQLPLAGIFPNKSGKLMKLCVGSGVCVDPVKLKKEIESFHLEYPNQRVIIDSLCPIITQEHVQREKEGDNYSESHTGSTKSGTGEARVDRVRRIGKTYKQFLQENINNELGQYLSINAEHANLEYVLNSSYDRGKKIIIEGTQGYYLSLYLSKEYPVVTSDNCTVSAFVDDVGLAWNKVNEVCMVIKSAPTRVSQNCGDLPGEIGKTEILELGIAEYGVTSGRLRRKSLIIPFDLLEEPIRVNSPSYVALTFCDHVDKFPSKLPYVISLKDLEAFPKTFTNVMTIWERFSLPTKYIEYGKEWDCISTIPIDEYYGKGRKWT